MCVVYVVWFGCKLCSLQDIGHIRQWHEASIEILWEVAYRFYGWKLVEKNGDLFGVFNNKMSLLFFWVASETVTKDVAIFFRHPRNYRINNNKHVEYHFWDLINQRMSVDHTERY